MIAAGIFGDNPGASSLVIWLAFALPFTFVAIGVLRFLWVEPVLKERVLEHYGVEEGFWSWRTKLWRKRKPGPDTESVLRKGKMR